MAKIIPKTYVCAACFQTKYKEVDTDRWNEDKRLAELKNNFGDVPLEQCERVCDDCYRSVMNWLNRSNERLPS